MSDAAPNEQVTNTQANVQNNGVGIAAARNAYEKAEADLKAAGNDATKQKMARDAKAKAAREIDLHNALTRPDWFKGIIESKKKKLAASETNLKNARNKYREIDVKAKAVHLVLQGERLHEDALNEAWKRLYPNDPVVFTKTDIDKIKQEYYKSAGGERTLDKQYLNKMYDELKAQRKKQGDIIKKERDKNIPKYKKEIAYMNDVAARAAKMPKSTTETNVNTGGTGSYGDGYTTTPYQDKDGNMVTATYDRNNQMQEVRFKDQEGKDQKLKADEIKKANINIDDIKAALESRDLKKALELLLAALVSKQNNYQIAGTTKEYKENDLVFKVEKSGQDITSISFQADGMEEPYVAGKEQFEKAGTNPKDIEQALEKKDFKTAARAIIGVQEANQTDTRARQEPELALKGNTIVLKDSVGQEFELNEAYLVSCGVKKSTAKGTMKKLSEALAIRPTPKGLEQAVGSYFRSENPSPVLPETQKGQWSFSKTNKTIVDQGRVLFGATTSDISITVANENGVKKKLKAEDFANYYGCDKKQGKKILKAFARAIDDGADMSGILSEIASNSKQSSRKRGKVEEIAVQAGKGLASEAKNKVYSIEEDLLRRAKNAALGRD